MIKKLIRKMLTAAGGPLFPWQLNTEWVNDWKFRTTPASRSKVLSGKGVETDKQYTERRKKETTKKTWRSDAADVAHGIGEGVLAFHPYTAIPYFGAKVGLDFLNGNVSWLTALNASVPLFHISPQAVGLREATNVALEDAANAGSKTARNLRVAREIKDNIKLTKLPYQEYSPIIRTKIGDVEINNPLLYYRLGSKEMGEDFSRTGIVSTDGEGFTNPMFAQGRLWYGIPTNKMLLQGKGILFKTSSGRSFNLTKRNEEAPKTDLLVSSAEMLPANLHSTPLKWVTTINGKTEVQNWGDRRVPATQATKENTVRYIFKPGYGYKKILLEPSTSLKFFERKPSKISEAERVGIPKGERFTPKWHIANYPGYLLKGLMRGSLLEKQLSKNGTININLLNAYFNKASQLEREVANKVLAEKFTGLKTIDYNLFKKAVLDELIGKYNRVPLTEWADYGVDGLGFSRNLDINAYNNMRETVRDINPELNDALIEHLMLERFGPATSPLKLNTFTFESPRILQGSDKHYDYGTLGHSRTYTTSEEPKILHVMESLSDWAQEGIAKTNEAYRQRLINNPESYNKRINSLLRMNEELEDWENMMRTGINHAGIKLQPYEVQQIQQEFIPNLQKNILNLKSKLEGNPQALHLSNNYLQRQLQENLRYAAENGLTKMRYPTSETAAKIEGYSATPKYDEVTTKKLEEYEKLLQKILKKIEKDGISPSLIDKRNTLRLYLSLTKEAAKPIMEYSPEHQTILKKYADFPKLFLKLFKDLQVRTATDAKGNTWYEVDVPKGYLSREWQFKQGGKMNILEFLKNGSGIHIKEKNKGKFTSYCGGKVTDECILKGKNSSNPAIRKRATFAANARKWKHLLGGIVLSPEEQRYLKWRNMTPKLQLTYRINRAKAYFDDGQLWNAAKSYFGGFDPKNPRLNLMTVENAPLPGKVNMSLYKDAKTVLKGSLYNEKFVNFIDRIVSGKGPIKGSPYFDAVDLKSETIPRGFIKGNEVTPIKGYPISEENLTIRTAKPINLENPITNEAEALAARDWIATYGKKGKYKQGGKAFVNGVSILDSNPDAYKYVKKKLKKHLEGGKTSTWLKIGNWVSKNLDAIKGIANIGSLLYSTIGGNIKAADFSNDYDEATKATIKAKTELQRAKNKKEAGILAAQFISYLLLLNPDVRYGELDLLQITLKIADSLYDPQEIIDYLNLRNAEKLKYMLAIQGSAGDSINWLDSLGGIASNFLNKSSNNNSNLSSTITPKLTTNTWKPSTSLSTPSLGTGTQGSIPDFSYMLNPNYKV